MDDQSIEKQIQAKNLTAPRVTPQRTDAVIASEYYHVPPGTTLTLCVLTLANGYTVTGESACASPANFDAEIGRNIARDNAKAKIWALEGYLLRSALHSEGERRSMDKVVELDTVRPHERASVRCGKCGHAWIAVFPVSCKCLECPQCHQALWLLRVPA